MRLSSTAAAGRLPVLAWQRSKKEFVGVFWFAVHLRGFLRCSSEPVWAPLCISYTCVSSADHHRCKTSGLLIISMTDGSCDKWVDAEQLSFASYLDKQLRKVSFFNVFLCFFKLILFPFSISHVGVRIHSPNIASGSGSFERISVQMLFISVIVFLCLILQSKLCVDIDILFSRSSPCVLCLPHTWFFASFPVFSGLQHQFVTHKKGLRDIINWSAAAYQTKTVKWLTSVC